MNEDKSQRFKRLASARTNEVTKRLKVLSNCANKSTYSYTKEEVDKIFTTIDRAAQKAKAEFKTNKRRENTFKL